MDTKHKCFLMVKVSESRQHSSLYSKRNGDKVVRAIYSQAWRYGKRDVCWEEEGEPWYPHSQGLRSMQSFLNAITEEQKLEHVKW